MGSNLLGDVTTNAQRRSSIISTAEVIAREGVNLQKGMNFRGKGPLLSVFLVLPRAEGFKDEWHPETNTYVYEGHDSVTVEGGALKDQVLMYESGVVSDNGKFYKAVDEWKGGVRNEPLAVQVYEKLDAGVWYDKGIFDLTDAAPVQVDGRRVYKFYLSPHGDAGEERMLSATEKSDCWEKYGGRCTVCGSQSDLYFTIRENELQLLCGMHSGAPKRGLL